MFFHCDVRCGPNFEPQLDRLRRHRGQTYWNIVRRHEYDGSDRRVTERGPLSFFVRSYRQHKMLLLCSGASKSRSHGWLGSGIAQREFFERGRRMSVRTGQIANGSSIKMSSRIKLPAVLMLGAGMLFAQTYYPPSESAGGWRRCQNEEDLRNKAGMDPRRLHLIAQEHGLLYGGPWAIAIVRKGYLVGEWFGVPTMPATTFDVWSCTKSATGIAFGLLFDDSRNHRVPGNVSIDLESPAYDFIPEGHPFTDPRKEKIRLKH